MFLYIPAIMQALLFAGILKIVVLYSGAFWILLLVLLVVAVFGYRIATKRWLLWYLVLLFVLSSWIIVHLIDSPMEKDIFIILSALIYYFFLFAGYRIGKKPDDKDARGIIAMTLMATAFLFFSATYGVYLNFEVSSWWLMLFYFANISIVSYRYFTIIEKRNKKLVLIYSLIIGLGLLEMGWVINFWPFGYLTSGAVLLMFYYILWDLAQDYFSDNLSKRVVLTNLFLFIFISGMVLYSSRWLPRI